MEKMKLLLCQILAVLLTISIPFGGTEQVCKTNEDCKYLGGLQCIKSACKWGQCGCPRGSVSRYLGSERLYQCVPLKKIGESCSNDTDVGVCGADSSICLDGVCRCERDKMSRYGGEICVGETDVFPSENTAGSQQKCQSSNPQTTSTFLNTAPKTCHCSPGYRVALLNDFRKAYQGKKTPSCQKIGVGDLCVKDDDCKYVIGGGAKCDTNKYECVCKEKDHVADITGKICHKALAFGANCTGLQIVLGVCDGSKGLMCGDVCDFTESFRDPYKKCKCSPTHTQTGPSSCKKNEHGSECHGDDNCKGINPNAICMEGVCKDSGTKHMLCLGLLLAMLMFNFILR